MTLGTAESCLEKYFDQLPSDRIRDHSAAQADHIHVVVFDSLLRRKTLMDQARPYARYLIGGNARTHATTADGHAAIHFAASNCQARGTTKSG